MICLCKYVFVNFLVVFFDRGNKTSLVPAAYSYFIDPLQKKVLLQSIILILLWLWIIITTAIFLFYHKFNLTFCFYCSKKSLKNQDKNLQLVKNTLLNKSENLGSLKKDLQQLQSPSTKTCTYLEKFSWEHSTIYFIDGFLFQVIIRKHCAAMILLF